MFADDVSGLEWKLWPISLLASVAASSVLDGMQSSAGGFLSANGFVEVKTLNALAVAGFVVLGLIFWVARTWDYGSVLGLTVFVGWFLVAYGLIAFSVATIASLFAPAIQIYHDLYLANYGLALIGISAIGIDRSVIILNIALTIVAMVCGLLFANVNFMRHHLMPFMFLIVVASFLPWASTRLGLSVCQFVGVFCVVISAATAIGGSNMRSSDLKQSGVTPEPRNS